MKLNQILKETAKWLNKKHPSICLMCVDCLTCRRDEVRNPSLNRCEHYKENIFLKKELIKQRLLRFRDYFKQTEERLLGEYREKEKYYRKGEDLFRFRTISGRVGRFFVNDARYKKPNMAKMLIDLLISSKMDFKISRSYFKARKRKDSLASRSYALEDKHLLSNLGKCLTKGSLNRFKRTYPEEARLIFKADKRIRLSSKTIERIFLDFWERRGNTRFTRRQLEQKFERLRDPKKKIDFYSALLNDMVWPECAEAEAEIGSFLMSLILIKDYSRLRVY